MPIFGLDLGKQCHYLRGTLRYDTTIHVNDIQIVPLSELREFLKSEFQRYYFCAGVCDAAPYTELVYDMVKLYPQFFSAVYTNPTQPKPELMNLSISDKYGELVRQVAINRDLAMSNLAEDLPNFYTFEPNVNQSLLIQHFTDMRKLIDPRSESVRYTWCKSKAGSDHLWHSATYLSIAAKLAQANIAIPASSFIGIKKFSTEPKK